MYADKTIAVVVPAYNEAHLIEKTLQSIPDFVDAIIVVDDASTDGTKNTVVLCKAKDSRINLVTHETNLGVGAAIVTGYKKAMDLGMEVAAVMAGDGQMDPEDLTDIVVPVAEGAADYTKGNRLFHGHAWHLMPRHRYLGNSFLSLLTKIASGYWHIADSQSGFTAISLSALQALDLDKVYRRYGMPNDFLIRLNEHGFRVKDVPIRPVYGVGETSGINLIEVVPRIVWILWKGFWRRLFFKYVIQDFHPLIFFYLLGLVLFPGGLLSGLYLLYHRLFIGPVAVTSALFAVFLFISGLQSLFFAMWFDMEYNKDLKIR
ncbi:MAG: glycosyltransferase family 2 protein [Deltaproteobacteria bacterium]|nr:glycosyltransferase family 2 protein [Deltaproteobacteria bacterium]